MPKIEITDSKGLVQKTGTGFESEKMPKSVLQMGSSVTKLVPAAANAVGVSYGGKYFVVAGESTRYQLWFSSIGGDAQTAPSKVDDNHQLVAIGNIAADATAANVATAIVAAVGAGAGAGIAELTAVAATANVTIASVKCQKSIIEDNRGSLDATHLTTFTVLARGAGDTAAGVALRPGAVNLLLSPDFGAGFTGINNDGSAAPDNAKFTLGDGDYAGQEVTIVRQTPASANTLGIHIVVLSHMRHLDGGGIVNDEEITLEASNHTDGSPLLKAVWDGSAWMSLMGTAEAQMGFSGSTASD